MVPGGAVASQDGTHVATIDRVSEEGHKMAQRKQFSSVTPVSEELKALLKKSRSEIVPDDVLKEQRVSFAFGNAPASDRITKQSVRLSSERIRLKG